MWEIGLFLPQPDQVVELLLVFRRIFERGGALEQGWQVRRDVGKEGLVACP